MRFDNYIIQDLDAQDLNNTSNYNSMVLAPRLSLLYKITPNIRWRIGYGKGYRAPQVFNEDLHIELINARRVEHFNDPELIQETSHSLSSSLNTNFNTGAAIHDLLVEGFFTFLKV